MTTIEQNFEYWYNRAQDLIKTKNDSFDTQEDEEWYINTLIKCIQNYTYWKGQQRKDVDEKIILTDCMFVTYNPRPDVSLKIAHKQVQDFIQKQKITKYIYVIEQRGTEESNIGHYHFHILHFHKYDRISHYKRETQSSFKKTCMVSNWACLNIKPCLLELDIQKRLEYMLGDKKDIDGLHKQEKQKIDKIFRQKYMLKDYYTDDYTHWEKYR